MSFTLIPSFSWFTRVCVSVGRAHRKYQLFFHSSYGMYKISMCSTDWRSYRLFHRWLYDFFFSLAFSSHSIRCLTFGEAQDKVNLRLLFCFADLWTLEEGKRRDESLCASALTLHAVISGSGPTRYCLCHQLVDHGLGESKILLSSHARQSDVAI